MIRALLPDTPRPPQFQPELPKNRFLCKLYFSRFTNRSLADIVCAKNQKRMKETVPEINESITKIVRNRDNFKV